MTKIAEHDVPALDVRWGRVPGVRFEQRYGGTVAVLEAAGGTAVVAIQGAQVLSWRPAGHSEVLWLSPVAKLGTGKAVRGGIPVCWPWFGPHPTDATKPAHGVVRAATWRVIGSAASAGRARLVLAFDTSSVDTSLWPLRAVAEIEITVAECLTVALTTENKSAADIVLTQALHTYLAVSDVGDVLVAGLDGRPYIDQLDVNARPVQGGSLAIDREIDRIYQDSPDEIVVTDRGVNREIRVAKSGSLSTVVWNPWIEKAARLGDMGENGHRRMLCVETANAGANVMTLAPRARHRLVTELSVKGI